MTKALHAAFELLPGHEARMRELIADLAAKIRAEPGNRRFVVHARTDATQCYHIDKTDADHAAFERPIASPHCQAFNKAIAGMLQGGASQVVLLTETG